MPSHQTLCDIDEIIRNICQFCDQATLATLARTRKSFTDPALDVLWETLTCFANLLRLLPGELVTWSHSGDGIPVPSIIHLIVPRDWTRFALYAPRIRNWVEHDLSYIDETVVDHIAFGRNPGYILPRLTEIEVTAATVSAVHLQTLILCPTLRTVTVFNPNPTTAITRAMQTFFRTLADRSPSLKHLIVHWHKDGVSTQLLTDGLCDVYRTVSTLENVHLWSPGCISAQSFYMLSQLPMLTTLRLNLLGAPDADDMCAQVKEANIAFPALHTVHLVGELDEFRKTLRFFGTNRIARIQFTARQYPRAKVLRTLFQAVAIHFSSSLQVLTVSVPKDEIESVAVNRWITSPDLYHNDCSVLSPLFQIRGLVGLHVELGVPLMLTDADLTFVGSAWPNIEVLNLCSDPYCEKTRGVRPPATIRGLFSLIVQCDRLHRLGLFLDYSLFMDTDLIANCSAISASVLHLDVGRSWITQPPLVAALLSGLFPALKAFQWSGMDDPDPWRELNGGHGPGWKQVFDLLPVFRATRTHERTNQSLAAIAMHID